MKRAIAARPRIPEKTWLLFIIPILWLLVLTLGHPQEELAEPPATISQAEKDLSK